VLYESRSRGVTATDLEEEYEGDNNPTTNDVSLEQESIRSTLPSKIDTRAVVEMIKNADLYDLINISMRANEMKEEQVELFIQKALMT
jgi:hypothetical protein